jgi:type VI secretion system FHA domain protein
VFRGVIAFIRAAMSFSLRIEASSLGIAPRIVELPEPVATVGRDAACTVVLQDPDKYVSRRHALVESRGGVCTLTVTSSANAVVVNGHSFTQGQTTTLRPGDLLSIPPFELTLIVTPDAAGISANVATPQSPQADPFTLDAMTPPPRTVASPPDPFRLDAPPNRHDDLVAGFDSASLGDEPLAPLPDASLDPLAMLDRSSAAAPQTRRPSAATRDAAESLASLLPNPLGDFDAPAPPVRTAAPEHVHDFQKPFAPAVPTPGSVPRPRTAPAAPLASRAQLAAFLAGLGLPHVRIAPDQEELFLKLAGEITRAAVEGIMALLLSRSQMKKELGSVDRTQMAMRDNNPLKLMPDAGEALRFLFDPGYRKTDAFLGPARAVQDACDDIFAHEVGLVAATRAAVEGAIRRFDPAQIERRVDEEKSSASSLLANRRARLWDAYLEHYQRIDHDMADNLDALFERDFLRAYTEQVKRLRRPPKKK